MLVEPFLLKIDCRNLLSFQRGEYAGSQAVLAGIRQGRLKSFCADGLVRAQSFRFRGITDTKGKNAEKKEASGHKTDAMLDLYDHEVAVVESATPGEAGRVL